MKKVILAVLALSLTSLCYSASIRSLNKYDARSTLEDKTIVTLSLATLNPQLPDNTVTINFGKEGKLTGQFAKKPESTLQSDVGTWSIKSNGQVCVTWTQWDHSGPTCVYVYKLAKSLLFINVQNGLESVALSVTPTTGNPIF